MAFESLLLKSPRTGEAPVPELHVPVRGEHGESFEQTVERGSSGPQQGVACCRQRETFGTVLRNHRKPAVGHRLGHHAQVRAVAARFAALSPEQQQALRAAFDQLPSDQRQDWWLGPEVGGGFAELRPLFAFVPEGERAALRALLRELTPATRADLAILARRLPASEREELRRTLVAAPPEAREALVRERLGR